VAEAVDKKSAKKESISEFITHTREELDRTSFPSSEEVRNTVFIVIVVVIFFAIYLFVIDKSWVFLLEGLTKLVNTVAGI